MSDLFDLLGQYRESLKFRGEDLAQQLVNTETRELFSIACQACALLTDTPKETTRWSYIANSNMSGLPTVCSAFNCRTKNLQDTAAFAASFADHLVLFNPFDYVVYSTQSIQRNSLRKKLEFIHAIDSLIWLEPLIELNLISFVEFNPYNICWKCLEEIEDSLDLDDRARLYLSTRHQLAKSITVKVGNLHSGKRQFILEAEDALLDHQQIILNLVHDSRLDDAFPPGTTLTMSQKMRFPYIHRRTQFETSDVFAKSSVSRTSQINGIFSSSFEILLLKKMFGSKFNIRIIEGHLPFFRTDNLSNLIRLREVEWHHFEDYRNLFFDVINDTEKNGTSLEEAYRLNVMPEAGIIRLTYHGTSCRNRRIRRTMRHGKEETGSHQPDLSRQRRCA